MRVANDGALLLGTLWFTLGLAQSPAANDLAASTTTSWRPIFTVPDSVNHGQKLLANVDDPEAVDAQKVCPGYKASNVQTSAAGFTADLDLAGAPCNAYGNDVANLKIVVQYQAADRLSVQIQPRYLSAANESWFVLPEALIPRPAPEGGDASSSLLDISWTNDPTFSFTITRKETGDVLFTTAGSVLVYEDQFIEFVSPLPENYNLYGLGEVYRGFRLGNNLTRTIYAADVGDPIDTNLYGSHPVYLDTRYFTKSASGALQYAANATDPSVDYTSYTHGVYLRNSHGQEIILKPSGITWRTLGGNIDLFFYNGPSVSETLAAYQKSAVGLPAMQQYWTFGFHQCRWGYENWTILQGVVDDFAKFEIPLETIWTDIDYMNQYRDFDNDQRRFSYAEGEEFLKRLHANNQHYVPIVDSAIYVPNPDNASDAYPTYDRGLAANAFLLNPDGSTYYGAVWPGYTVFPDWVGSVLNGSGTFDWWTNEVVEYHSKVNFSGIWIDMSEVSSFCVGSCGTNNLTLNPVHPPFSLPGEPGNVVYDYPEGFDLTNATEAASASAAASSQASAAAATAVTPASTTTTPYLRTTPTPGVRNVNWPPYVIDHVQDQHDLAVHAVSPNATHHGGTQEYDFHNLFGHQILNATYNALLAVFEGKRPFLLGRSTFAGSGKWAAHWGGDNGSKWYHMAFSIPQALSFSVFGVPMFGVDTCGFNGQSDMELCARWMQLSAFFPFYRNHNVLSTAGQEPYRWQAVIGASRTAMAARYALLPYLYTLFARAHADGAAVMRALAWEFPGEPWLAGADRQFLLGDAVMVTPVLVQGASTVGGVFPGADTVWYDWYNLTRVVVTGPAQNVTIDAPLGHIPVYIRGGKVIPTQEPAMTTTASRKNPWAIIAALDGNGAAQGELYLDDGESLAPTETTWVTFTAGNSTLTATPKGNYVDTNPLRNITVLGVPAAPKEVQFNGKVVPKCGWTYSQASSSLAVAGLRAFTRQGAWAESWTLTWS